MTIDGHPVAAFTVRCMGYTARFSTWASVVAYCQELRAFGFEPYIGTITKLN